MEEFNAEDIIGSYNTASISNLAVDNTLLNNLEDREIQNFAEAKLFLNVKSLEYPLISNKTLKWNDKYVCDIEILNDIASFQLYKLHSNSSQTSKNTAATKTIFKAKDKFYSWDFGQYYGQLQVKITIKYVNFLTFKILGTKVLKLSEFLCKQNENNKSNHWSTEFHFPVLSTLHCIGSNKSSNINSSHNLSVEISEDENHHNTDIGLHTMTIAWFNKTAAHATGHLVASTDIHNHNIVNLKHTANASSSSSMSALISRSPSSVSQLTFHLCLEFRLVMLRNCQSNLVYPCCHGNTDELPIRLCTVASVSNERNNCLSTMKCNSNERINELHLLVMTAPVEVIISILKKLTLKNILKECLATRTSNGLTPFDIALIYGRECIVREMLSRCGNLCFQDIAVNHSTPIHYAVIGGSFECMQSLLSFLRKYATKKLVVNNTIAAALTDRDIITDTGRLVGIEQNELWLLDLVTKLDWVDANGNTALALACMIPNRHLIVKILIANQANICAVNYLTKSTPLLNACQIGDIDTVRVLLNFTKSRTKILYDLYGWDSLTEIRKSALYKHMQVNTISRNLLLGNNRNNGGHFNLLSMYLCNPEHCDVFGRQAIHIAAEYGHNEIFIRLFKLYSNSNKGNFFQVTDFSSNNFFHILAKSGNSELINKLIEIESDKLYNRNLDETQTRQYHNQTDKNYDMMVPLLLLDRNSDGKLPVDLSLSAGFVLLSFTLMQETFKQLTKKLTSLHQCQQLDNLFLIQHLIYVQESIMSTLPTDCSLSNASEECADILSKLNQLRHQYQINYSLTRNNDIFIDDTADAFEYAIALSSLSMSKLK